MISPGTIHDDEVVASAEALMREKIRSAEGTAAGATSVDGDRALLADWRSRHGGSPEPSVTVVKC